MRKKTIAFSKRAIKAATPAWLNWTLAIILVVAYVVKLTVAQDNAISDDISERILLYVGSVELLVNLLANMFGQVPDETEE
jgi:hypothetical protein